MAVDLKLRIPEEYKIWIIRCCIREDGGEIGFTKTYDEMSFDEIVEALDEWYMVPVSKMVAKAVRPKLLELKEEHLKVKNCLDILRGG